jgi:hypothetical protein
MNNILKRPLMLILPALLAVIFLAGCATGASPAVRVSDKDHDWVAPMLSLKLSNDGANLYNGTINVARANSAEGSTPVVRTGQVTSSGITEALLIANGAVKATANLRYNGDNVSPVRFRLWIDEFSGHSVVRRVPNAAGDANDRVLALWKDPDGTWWDLRRATLGGPNTGGTVRRFTLKNGSYVNPAAIWLDRDTASQYASVDFYIIVLDPAQAHDEVAGYVVTYYAEMPDRFAAHFHAFEILVSTSTPLTVNPVK